MAEISGTVDPKDAEVERLKDRISQIGLSNLHYVKGNLELEAEVLAHKRKVAEVCEYYNQLAENVEAEFPGALARWQPDSHKVAEAIWRATPRNGGA